MITKDKCAEIVRDRAYVREVEIPEDGEHVVLISENGLDDSGTLLLIVHPAVEELVVRVRAYTRLDIENDRTAHAVLAKLIRETLTVRPFEDKDGELCVEVNHASRDGDDVDPAPDVLLRLVDDVWVGAHRAMAHLLAARMAASGLPKGLLKPMLNEMQDAVDRLPARAVRRDAVA